MSKRKQKIVLEGFTFTIGKLIVEQEAEDFDSDELTNNVRSAIGQVISAPSRLLIAESTTPPPLTQSPPVTDVPPKTRRRRRKGAVSASSDSAGDGNGERSARGSTTGAKGLIRELKTDGFFAQDRAVSEVRDELKNRGHSFESRGLSTALLAMTKDKELSRRKDDDGGWVYRAG